MVVESSPFLPTQRAFHPHDHPRRSHVILVSWFILAPPLLDWLTWVLIDLIEHKTKSKHGFFFVQQQEQSSPSPPESPHHIHTDIPSQSLFIGIHALRMTSQLLIRTTFCSLLINPRTPLWSPCHPRPHIPQYIIISCNIADLPPDEINYGHPQQDLTSTTDDLNCLNITIQLEHPVKLPLRPVHKYILPYRRVYEDQTLYLPRHLAAFLFLPNYHFATCR